MKDELTFGILGMSPGNGHPYSWSAIMNGYDPDVMRECPYPAIPAYLGKQKYPEDFIQGCRVTHVWTQDAAQSAHIAKAAKIETVVQEMDEMLDEVDAVLLARDDAETHLEFALPVLKKGLPIYIDKPLALTTKEAQELYAAETFEGQIFSCSALRYAPELQPTAAQREELGELLYVEAYVPHGWNTYGIHAVDPVLRMIGDQGGVADIAVGGVRGSEVRHVHATWKSGLTTSFHALGDYSGPIVIQLFGTKGTLRLPFVDAFTAFKSALFEFVQIVSGARANTSKPSVLNAVEILEAGYLYQA